MINETLELYSVPPISDLAALESAFASQFGLTQFDIKREKKRDYQRDYKQQTAMKKRTINQTPIPQNCTHCGASVTRLIVRRVVTCPPCKRKNELELIAEWKARRRAETIAKRKPRHCGECEAMLPVDASPYRKFCEPCSYARNIRRMKARYQKAVLEPRACECCKAFFAPSQPRQRVCGAAACKAWRVRENNMAKYARCVSGQKSKVEKPKAATTKPKPAPKPTIEPGDTLSKSRMAPKHVELPKPSRYVSPQYSKTGTMARVVGGRIIHNFVPRDEWQQGFSQEVAP